MTNLYSLLDVGALTLSAYKMQANVAAENIANANKHGYIPKAVEAERFRELMEGLVGNEGSKVNSQDIQQQVLEITQESNSLEIRLDDEIYLLNKAKGRYEVVAQVLKTKLSMIEAAIGGAR